MTVADLFEAARLSPLGPVGWGTAIPMTEKGGVYVVALVAEAGLVGGGLAEFLDPSEQKRWLPNQPVVYIGQTTTQTLAKRLEQFYRHEYGDKSPHRGGQALKLLLKPPVPWSPIALWVYWSAATDPKASESTMIEAFKNKVGRLPFANRRV